MSYDCTSESKIQYLVSRLFLYRDHDLAAGVYGESLGVQVSVLVAYGPQPGVVTRGRGAEQRVESE